MTPAELREILTPEMAADGDLRVEATGETVGEAKWSALRELERLQPGIDKSAVRFQVLSEGERGLLGVGYSPARVVAVVGAPTQPPPPREESALAADVREVVQVIVGSIGGPVRVEVEESEDGVAVSCAGPDLGVLIGKHGQTIDAIQYLVNAVVARSYPDSRKDVIVDAAGYRERRRAALESLAVRSAERALATGAPVELDPMTAVERKLVHLRLQDYAGVETTSEGAEPNRYVVVAPSDA
jgi:spoIIIJ-associated protein